MKPKHLWGITGLALMICMGLPSCSSNSTETLEFKSKLPSVYSNGNPAHGDITLFLDDVFTHYSANFNYGQNPALVIPIGEILGQQAETVARGAFSTVAVVRGGSLPNGLVLRPQVVRVVRTEPSENMYLGVFLKWQIMNGQEILFEKTIRGFGQGAYGSYMFESAMQDELQSQLKEALGNAFRLSFEAVSTAVFPED